MSSNLMVTDLQHVSTFSGVGGIDLALARAGVKTVAACEIDKHARGVLAARYPSAHLFHDVKDVTADALFKLGLDPRRTVLSGGFPCQDVSVAGARRGLGEGTRSGLYWELDRIMAEFRPAWVVFENVPGLLSATCACPGDGTCEERGLARECPGDGQAHSVTGGACWGDCLARHGGVMGAILGSLAERGYGFAYRVLDAQHFGVPQRRRRVVIVGRLGDSGAAPGTVLLEPEGVPGDPCEGIAPRARVATEVGGGAPQGGVIGVLGDQAHTLTAEGQDASEDRTGRGTPVIAFDHKAGGEGDAAREDQSPTLTGGRDGMAVAYVPALAATLTADISSKGVSAPGRRQEDDTNVVAFHVNQDPISGGVSPALGATGDGMGVAYMADKTSTLTAGGGRRGHRIDSESAAGSQLIAYARDVVGALGTQGGPDDNAAQGGHLVAHDVATFQKVTRPASSDHPDVWEERDVAATLSAFDLGSESRSIELVVAPTLTASLGEGGWAGHNRKDEMVERTFEAVATVRRLTPKECERLQGYPDDHTIVSNGKAQADAQRYKQMGNSVAVPVFEWVARRLVAVDRILARWAA